MAQAQKPDLVFRRNGRVHLNRRGRQISRLLAAEVCASPLVMLDTPCSEVVCKTTHSTRMFPLYFPPHRASPCAITFQLDPTVQTVRLHVAVLNNSMHHNGFGYLAHFGRHEVAQSVEPLHIGLEVSRLLHVLE